jgi:hypothetical protein
MDAQADFDEAAPGGKRFLNVNSGGFAVSDKNQERVSGHFQILLFSIWVITYNTLKILKIKRVCGR